MCIFYTKLSIFFKTKRFASPWEVGGENDARNGTEVDKVIWTIFLSEVAIGTGKKSLDKNHLINVTGPDAVPFLCHYMIHYVIDILLK